MLVVMTYGDVLILTYIFLAISGVIILSIFLQKRVIKKAKEKNLEIQELLMKRYGLSKEVTIKCSIKRMLYNFFILTQRVQLSQSGIDEIYQYFWSKKAIKKLIRKVNSKNLYTRIRSITYLSLFRNETTKKALLDRLLIERKEHIKILIVNGLKRDIDEEVLKGIISSLILSKRYYQKRVIKILIKYIDQSAFDLSIYFQSPIIEIKEAFIELSMQIYHPSFETPLKNTLSEIEDHYIQGKSLILQHISKHRINRLYYQTLTALSSYYGFDLNNNKYLMNTDDEVVKIAAKSLVIKGDLTTIEMLINFASLTPRDAIYTDVIYEICENEKEYYQEILKLFKTDIHNRKKYILAGVLSKKLDYILLTMEDKSDLKELMNAMIMSKHSVNIINFLNSNKNLDLQKELLEIIAPIAKENYDFYLELNDYLNPEIFKRMGHIHLIYPGQTSPEVEPETRKFKWLLIILVIIMLFLPITFAVTNLNLIFNSNFRTIVFQYVIDLNIWFIAYYLVVNGIYLVFAILALFEYRKQERLWNIKNEDFLYENGILTPISIMVPAYNEELTIVESLHSLLSLKYPVYEVLVVNDGSKDKTLDILIEAFDLKRVDYRMGNKIRTRLVKAVYKNKFYPKLTVIDKVNGGKADSLNACINFSKYDYVCGIDADSLIESDGILKMMASALDSDKIPLALGGSIVPVNGATVDHGLVEKYELPKKALTRFQTIEYLRAFNTGRLAFSKLKCFLIVSGAFGLFEKRMLVEIGGYLSASSFKKKTVGEDLELVVRITKKAAETHLNYRVGYVPMARCYTEIPEKRKTLFSQRNRWQRGLIETLSYHRKMILNPKYNANGLFAMPYFFLFEMIAPLLEIQVYATLIIGLIFGLFNGVFILLLLVITFLFGMCLSLVSLFIQERYTATLTRKDTFIIILYGIIENFGWRQIISLYRAWGYMTSLTGKHTWGSMNRVGFKK